MIDNNLCDKCDCKGYNNDPLGDGECSDCGHIWYEHFWITKPKKPDPDALENFESQLGKLGITFNNITDDDLEDMCSRD